MIHFKPLKFGKTEKITLLVLAALAFLVIGVNQIPAVATWYTNVNGAWTEWAVRFGILGAFLAALIGNITIVIIFPYTVVVFFLATTGVNPFLLGLATGTGAVLGELSGYFLGRWGAHTFQRAKPEAYDSLKRIVRSRPSLVRWLLFVFSLLPLPDDVLFIPLGMLRYSFWQLLWPSWLGKVGAGLIVAYFGRSLEPVLNGQAATSPLSLFSEIGSLTAVVLVMYAILKMDWTKMMHRLLDRTINQAEKTAI